MRRACRHAREGGTHRKHNVYGFTEAQIAEFGLTFGLAGFILFMLFIVWDLARKSKAGRLGTFVLFFVLAFGMFGFVAKTIIAKLLGI
jgi:hypothetical protein